MTEEKTKEKPAPKKKRTEAAHDPYRKLTVSQKAEAAALWRTGTVTLEDLSAKYKKRKESFSRMFKEMGITRGSGAEEAAKKVAEMAETRMLSDAEETMRKITAVKEDHFRMAGGLAKLAWAEIARARQAGIDISTLKDLMSTLKMAGDVIGNARKELFAVLNVEKYDQEHDFENLPELTVRELTGTEIVQLQNTNIDEMGVDEDGGADLSLDDPAEGF